MRPIGLLVIAVALTDALLIKVPEYSHVNAEKRIASAEGLGGAHADVVMLANVYPAGGVGVGHDVYGDRAGHTSKSVEYTKPYTVPIIKVISIPVPHPVPVTLPQAIAIPVPQPVPVHVKVPTPVEVPILKTVHVPVETPYPVTVEKKVPYTIDKPYPIHVEKHVPIPVPKPYPIPVPVYKHVYHDKGHYH